MVYSHSESSRSTTRPPRTIKQRIGQGVRFVLSLPWRFVRFVFRLPILTIRGIKRAAYLLYRGRMRLTDWLKKGWQDFRSIRRWIRIRTDPAHLRHWAYLYLRPARLIHRWRSWQGRFTQRDNWQAVPALDTVRKAIRWGRTFRRHTGRFRDIGALRSTIYADETIQEKLPGKPTLGFIAQRDVIRRRWGAFLHGLILYTRAQRALDVNTTFGFSALYMARGLLDTYPVRTCMLIALGEPSPYLSIARKNLYRLGYDDFADIREGRPADHLGWALAKLAPVDLAFIGGRSGEKFSLRDFGQIAAKSHPGTLIVVDDIHGSKAMEQTWAAIQDMPRIAAAVDLWQWGIVVVGDGPAKRLYARL